jgi:hypothetical protein
MMNNYLWFRSLAKDWPRLCENPNSKTQSGKSKPIHGFSIKDVGFMNPVQ